MIIFIDPYTMLKSNYVREFQYIYLDACLISMYIINRVIWFDGNSSFRPTMSQVRVIMYVYMIILHLICIDYFQFIFNGNLYVRKVKNKMRKRLTIKFRIFSQNI